MAKRPPKAKVDPLRVALKQLATADKDSARAVSFLCKAILVPVQKPVFKLCEFKLGKKKYNAKLTSSQRQAVLKTVSENGNVLATVSEFLGAISFQVAECINALMNQLGDQGKKITAPGVTLGCCVYQGGRTPNLSKAQCNQYHPVSWDPGNADCTRNLPP